MSLNYWQACQELIPTCVNTSLIYCNSSRLHGRSKVLCVLALIHLQVWVLNCRSPLSIFVWWTKCRLQHWKGKVPGLNQSRPSQTTLACCTLESSPSKTIRFIVKGCSLNDSSKSWKGSLILGRKLGEEGILSFTPWQFYSLNSFSC